eukprot:COSAG02_NODE_1994_length_10160_cov_84.117483_5_plen_64_part_00
MDHRPRCVFGLYLDLRYEFMVLEVITWHVTVRAIRCRWTSVRTYATGSSLVLPMWMLYELRCD